ncbi:hypothetical protein N0V82_002751 [Gnomoniopsis sp. IMI 355080]|nr:hypothetical protein N0V82_002751 [Gnomoniopsis sp. IMI 355080]
MGVRTHAPAAKRASSSNAISSNVLSLKKSRKAAKSAGYLSSMRSRERHGSSHSIGVEPVVNIISEEYIASIEFGGVPYDVLLDTGSSDTWLVQSGFTCVDINSTVLPEADCSFGPVFNGTFSDGIIANQHFDAGYADGEFMNGAMGYENITLAGISVKQEIALVNYTYWFGDEISSGLMGLAYPLLTSAYEGTGPSNSSSETRVQYNPIIPNLIAQGLMEPVFSLSLQRNSSDGFLALGGLPPVNFTGASASTPILMYSFYTIVADAYIYEGSEKRTHVNTASWNSLFSDVVVNTTQFPVIVDSGTTLLYLPTEMYEDLIALYDPPAIYIPEQFAAFAPCNASVPKLSIQINGTVFPISEADMLMQDVTDPDTGYCLIGPQDGTTGPYILGDTFMNNVISVFDVGASEMRFIAHDY